MLHRQIFRHFDLGNHVSRLRSEHTDPVVVILFHEAVKVRTAEFSSNGRDIGPSPSFKAVWQGPAMHRSANGGLPPSLRSHLWLSDGLEQ
jgi:hypothetical protein